MEWRVNMKKLLLAMVLVLFVSPSVLPKEHGVGRVHVNTAEPDW